MKKVLPQEFAMALIVLTALTVAGCDGAPPPLPASAGYGAKPILPSADPGWPPTAHFTTAIGWPKNRMPRAPTGFTVTRFAGGLHHPRWLYVLPNGDVLVAEAATVPKPAEGFFDWLRIQWSTASGAIAPSANRITLLRDADGDGVAELRSVFAGGLNQPFGMVLVGQDFFVANTDAILRFDYLDGQTRLNGRGQPKLSSAAGASTES